MGFLRGLFTAILILAAVVIGGSFLLPSQVHVERSTIIEAEPAKIFPYINNFHRFNEWSPWAERDPNTSYAFAGPDQGVGAKLSWRSDNDEVGSGSQEIIESTANEKVVTALNFGDVGKAQATFQLIPNGASTKVTWMLDTNLPINPVSRWMGLLLDRLVGPNYEEGLRRLKAKVENNSSAQSTGFVIG